MRLIVQAKDLDELEKQHYYMHVTATGICMDDQGKPLPNQQALLRYMDFPEQQNPMPPQHTSPGVVSFLSEQ